MKRDTIISHLTNLFGTEILEKAKLVDFMANGVQIHGKENVSKIIIGVSPTVEFFKIAEQKHADFIITKHPLYIAPVNQTFDPSTQERLRYIFRNDWTMSGYHFALDIHPTLGNTPILLQKLGVKIGESIHNGWGYVGQFERPVMIQQFIKNVATITNHTVFPVLPAKLESVQKIALVTGGAVLDQTGVMELIAKGVQVYITGEISEWAVHLFQESNVAYLAAGHHATEVFGPQALADKLSKDFSGKAEVEFVNVWNEI